MSESPKFPTIALSQNSDPRPVLRASYPHCTTNRIGYAASEFGSLLCTASAVPECKHLGRNPYQTSSRWGSTRYDRATNVNAATSAFLPDFMPKNDSCSMGLWPSSRDEMIFIRSAGLLRTPGNSCQSSRDEHCQQQALSADPTRSLPFYPI